MKFFELIRGLEQHFGNHHFPVNPCAETIRDIFDNTPVHADLVKRLVRDIYKSSACRHLQDKVDPVAINEILGPLRLEIMQASTTDIDTYHFLHDLCYCINDLFVADARTSQKSSNGSREHQRNTSANRKQHSGEVISLEGRRHLRWLKSSA